MFNNNNTMNPYWINNHVPNGYGDNYATTVPNTNVLRVTSLDEAIMKTNARNSEMVYFNQSKDEFYTVRVDMNGNKSWQVFPYTLLNTNANAPVTKAEYDALATRLETIENQLKEMISNESDGQKSV